MGNTEGKRELRGTQRGNWLAEREQRLAAFQSPKRRPMI